MHASSRRHDSPRGRVPSAPDAMAAVLLLLPVSAGPLPGQQDPAPAPSAGGAELHRAAETYRSALELVTRALDATVGPEEIRAAGGLLVEAEGVKNAGAEGQGWHPDSLSPGRYREALALAADGETVGYGYRHDRYDGTWERLREVYGPGDRRRIFVLDQGLAVHLASPDHAGAGRRLGRRLPGVLLAEARDRPGSLRMRGRIESGDGRGERDAVTATLAGGETVDLLFEPASGRLREAVYLADAPTFGDVSVAWRFGEYRDVAGVGALPHRYGASLRGRPFTEMAVVRAEAGAAATGELLEPPAGIEVPEVREVRPGADASADARAREVGPGVYLAVNLRGGFHPMFVEFEDFVVAVDAPAGYPEWDRLPASDVAQGPSASWLSERFLELIRETLPDKPVRHVVLTHHHQDHAGGVRAFVAEGSSVLASPPTAAVVRRAMGAPHSLAPDRLAREGGELDLEVVRERRTITDGHRVVEVIDVGPNPHTEHMLVLRLPEEGIWFVSDLLDAAAVERFPKPEHAALDRWFGRWLRGTGHTPGRIYTIHGSALVTPEHLAKLDRDAPRAREEEG